MKTKEEHILEAYRKGNLAQRLNMFMTYRDLRECFTHIEQADTAAPVSEKPARCRSHSIRQWFSERLGFGIPFPARVSLFQKRGSGQTQ